MNLVVIDLDKVREIAKDLPNLDAALRSSLGMQITNISKPLRNYLSDAYTAGYNRSYYDYSHDDGPKLPLTFEDFLTKKGYD